MRCLCESHPLLLAPEELDLKQMVDHTARAFEMDEMQFQLPRDGRTAKLKGKGGKCLQITMIKRRM